MTRERAVTRPGEPARMPAAGRVCGQDAGPDWCTAPVHSRGMCRRHYRRAARGQELDPEGGMVVGLSPSGHGIWGVLTEADDRLLCHECGRWYAALGVHVGMVHDGARAYRLAHGLPLHTPLTATALHEARSQRALSSGLVQQVEQHRSADTLALADPAMAGRGHRLRRRA